MAGKRKIHKISDKKKSGPFLKFNLGVLILIFSLSFIGCFILYMVSANMDDDYFNTKNKTDYEYTDNLESESENSAADAAAASDSSAAEASTNWLLWLQKRQCRFHNSIVFNFYPINSLISELSGISSAEIGSSSLRYLRVIFLRSGKAVSLYALSSS